MSQQFKKRTKTALDHMKLRMYGEKINGAKQAPSFLFYLTEDGNPRIDVYTGVEGDKDNGLIRAAMDIRTARALLELGEVVVDNSGPCRYYITNRNYLWPGGKRSDSPVEVSKTVIGKAEDGRIYISVVAKDRPKAIFYMTAPFFHNLVDAENQPVPKDIESRLFARGYFKHVGELLANVATATYKEPAPRGQHGGGGGNNNNYNNRGGNGGGGNNNGGGNYNNNSSSGGNNGSGTDFDKDIPF